MKTFVCVLLFLQGLTETQQQRRLSVSLLQDVYYVFPETDLTISVNVSFPLTENYMVTWKHKEKNSDFAEDINNRNLGIKYAGGSLGQPSLTINNVTDFDAGEYFIDIQPIEVADSGSSAGPATVHVLSKKSKEYYTASAEVCPPNWQTFYEIGSALIRKRCVQKVEQTASFYQAQTICRQQRAFIVPVVIRLSPDGNETDPFAYLPRTDVWTGGYEEYGSLVSDGAPPIFLDTSMLSYGRGINISDAWTEGNPFCIGVNNLYQELQIRDCNERLPFLCYKEADILSFKPNLNTCPSGWIGAEDVGSCYLLTKDPKQPLDAIEVCNQNGGTLLQLQLVKDRHLTLRLLVHLALFNSSVWFSEVESPVSCSFIRLSESMEISSATNCSIAASVVCQTNKKNRMYTSSELQMEFQKPKFNTNGVVLNGNLSCKFPAPHLETDTYSVYKGGAIVDRLTVLETNYSREIMKWNPELPDEEMFLSSASANSDVYRCDIQRKGVGLVLSKTIYAVPNEKRVSIFHATVSMTGSLSLQDALVEAYMSSPESLLGQSRRAILSKIYSVSRDIRPVSGGQLGFIGITSIPLRKRNALDFLLYFVGPNEEWKSAEAMNYLLNNITISARTRSFGSRRRRRQALSVDFNTFEIRNEEYCTVGYSPDFQSTYNFKPVGNGSMTYSEELCITDSEPLLSGLCYTRTAAPAEIQNVTVNPNCQFLLNPSFANMTALKKLSNVPTNDSNVEIVASDVANLTSNSSDLTVEDVVFTSMVLENVASISSISEQTTSSVLQTLSNILEAPEEILMNAHTLGSSTTRILESVETITRNVVLNGTEYRNYQKSFAVAVTDVTSEDSPVIGIQLKNVGIDVVLDNDTIGLINAEDSINITSFDTAIILPKDLVQGNNSRVIFTIFESTKIFQVRQMNKRYELNGKVASATLISNGKSVLDLGRNFVRSIYKPINITEDSVCGFWNHSLYATSGGWSTRGCQRTEVEDGLVVCECDHLTNFAILLDVKGQSDIIDKVNTLALSIITIIGLSLSIVGLGLTVLSFLLFKQLRKGRGQQTLLNLSLALLCSMVIFLAGMERTDSYYGCITVAALMHYFLLVSFMWMLVEGFLQYLRFVRVLGTYVPRFILKASIPAWGLPLIPVVSVLAVDYDLYRGGKYYCWMSPTPFYYAFLLPVALIIIVNCIVFALVLKTLLNRPKGLQSNQSESKRAMMNLRAAVSIFILLGLTWIFGILAIEDARIVFSYIFTILTTFQGFFIFILFVAREKQLRTYWGKLCCKRFIDRQKKYKPTSASHSSSQPLSKLSSHETASTEIFLSSK